MLLGMLLMELDRNRRRVLGRHALHAGHHDVVLVLGGRCHLGLVSLLGLLGLLGLALGCCLVSRRLSRLGCRGTRAGTSASARCRRPCSRGRG